MAGRRWLRMAVWTVVWVGWLILGLTVSDVAADDIGTQDYNGLSDTGSSITESVTSGLPLPNAGSYNTGGPGLDFMTYWIDTRGTITGPVTSGESGDYIGVSSFTGSYAPDVAPDGTAVSSGVEHNFQFNDTDGRLDLVFEPVDLTGLTNRSLSLYYWIATTGYESDDAFYVTLSDGTQDQTYLNFGEEELEANVSADDGSANWNQLTVDLDALISGSGFGEVLTLTVSVDTNSGSENIFVDKVLFVGYDVPEPDTSIAKWVDAALPVPGDIVEYTVLLRNTGTATDTVVFTDTLPTDVDWDSWVERPTGAVHNPANGEITWAGDILAGETVTFTCEMVNQASGGTVVTNTAAFSGTVGMGVAEVAYEAPVITPIHDIQGMTGVSPEDGNVHTIEGIVIGDFQDSSELRGYFVQEEDADADMAVATSEGIFVYSTWAVSAGDKVRIRGTVDEYYGLTQLTSLTDRVVIDTGQPMPTISEVTLPVGSATVLERTEGMYVSLPQELTVTENYNLGRGGLVELSSGERLWQPTQVVTPGGLAIALQAENDRNRIIMDDYGTRTQSPDPIIYPSPYLSATNTLRSGDTVSNIVGVLSYSWSGWSDTDAYRVFPTQSPTIVAANPRPMSAPMAVGDVTVATFNVYNYFDTFAGCTEGVGGAATNCRGADDATEFTRQRDKIITALLTLDADIVGLQELENDGYGDEASAIDDLVDGLNDVAGAGTYAYIDVDANTGTVNALGTDAIKVGVIYKPASVTPVGDTAFIDDSVDVGFREAYNRPALAQSFRDTVHDQVLTVVVNHLKSKGSDCEAVSDPDAGDGQGNCNLTRLGAVNAILSWLDTDPTDVDDPDVLILGDLNSYAMEDPIVALEDAGYTNLLKQFGGEYGYAYFGQWGTLDYVFASPSFASRAKSAASWHINADEPSVLNYNVEYKSAAQVDYLYSGDAYRASDHDPIVVGIAYEPHTVIAKTVDPVAARIGEAVTYTIVLENQGTAVDTVMLTDTLPTDVTFGAWAMQPAGAVHDGGTITWSGTISATASETFVFTVVNDLAIGTVENTAEFDAVLTSGSDSASFDVIIEPDTSISKSASVTEAQPDEVVVYTIQLQNDGMAADSVVMTDTLPPEATFARWLVAPAGTVLAGDTITWTGILPAGHNLTWSFEVTNTASSGMVTNTAEFAGLLAVGEDSADYAGVLKPGTYVSKSVTPATAKPGETVVYTIELENTGLGADSVVLTDTLPTEVDFASWLVMPPGTLVAMDEITWSGAVASGQTLTWSFEVTNTASTGVVTNTARFAGLEDSRSDSAVFTAAMWCYWFPVIAKDWTP